MKREDKALTNSATGKAVIDVTRPDEAASTNNTLYLIEGTNGTAKMSIQGWWTPETVSSNSFRWEIVFTNGAAGATQWNLTNGIFNPNPSSVIWTNSATAGVTNRQFLVRGWYDCNKDSAYADDEPHRIVHVTILKCEITEVKGLYTSYGTYQAGYTSTDNVGRIYSSRVYDPSDLTKTIWSNHTQYVDITVKVSSTNATLPSDARIVWEVEDPDDPSDSDMTADAAQVIDPNGSAGKDNTGSRSPGAQTWEQLSADYALDGANTNETKIKDGISKVRFNVTDHGGDNFIVKPKLKLNAGATPCDGTPTGIMTVWKKINIESVTMSTADALPVNDIPGQFTKSFVEFKIALSRPVSDGIVDNGTPPTNQWVMGLTEKSAYSACLDYVTAASGEFSQQGPGWFFVASAHEFIPLTSLTSEVLYPPSGTASTATVSGDTVTLPIAIATGKVPDVVYIYNAALTANVMFSVKKGTLSGDRKTFEIEKKDYYEVDSPSTSFLDANLTDYGFPTGSTVNVRVKSPGSYGVGGISPRLAGKTIVFTGWVTASNSLDTLVHELTHAFGLAHKCGNWDYKTTTPSTGCTMNYGTWFILDDATPRAPVPWTDKRTGTALCAPHIKAVRESKLEDLPSMGW